MKDIILITAVDKNVGSFQTECFIPKGAKGTVIDIIIEDGKASFLLDFDDYDCIEWYEIGEIEEKC